MLFLFELLRFQWHVVLFYVRELYYAVFRNRPRKDIKNAHILITGK